MITQWRIKDSKDLKMYVILFIFLLHEYKDYCPESVKFEIVNIIISLVHAAASRNKSTWQ